MSVLEQCKQHPRKGSVPEALPCMSKQVFAAGEDHAAVTKAGALKELGFWFLAVCFLCNRHGRKV